MNLQYALYFLVVGAAIWASSWAGELLSFEMEFGSFPFLALVLWFLLFRLNSLKMVKLWLQRYLVGCGLEKGNQPR